MYRIVSFDLNSVLRSYSFGYDSTRICNLEVLDKDVVVYVAGAFLVVQNLKTLAQRYFQTIGGVCFGAVTVSVAYITDKSLISICYSAPVGEWSIATSQSVCLSVREYISGTAVPIVRKLVCRSPVAVAWSFSGVVAIRYVLPVLRMTSHLAVLWR